MSQKHVFPLKCSYVTTHDSGPKSVNYPSSSHSLSSSSCLNHSYFTHPLMHLENACVSFSIPQFSHLESTIVHNQLCEFSIIPSLRVKPKPKCLRIIMDHLYQAKCWHSITLQEQMWAKFFFGLYRDGVFKVLFKVGRRLASWAWLSLLSFLPSFFPNW